MAEVAAAVCSWCFAADLLRVSHAESCLFKALLLFLYRKDTWPDR